MSQSPQYGDADYFKPGKAIGNPVVMTYGEFSDLMTTRGWFNDSEHCDTFYGRYYNPLPTYVIHYPYQRRVFDANVMVAIRDELDRLKALGLDLINLLSCPDEYFFATSDEAVHDKLYLVKLAFG